MCRIPCDWAQPIKRPAGEFRPVVSANRHRGSTEHRCLIQQASDVLSRDAEIDRDIDTFPAEIISNRQTLDAPPIGKTVTHKIHAPHLIDPLRELQRHALTGGPLGLLAFPHCKIGLAVKT